MKRLHIVARVKIAEGKLAELTKLAEQAVAMVREKEPGTLQYEWFLGADQANAVVLETFESSEALLIHFQNMATLIGQRELPGKMEMELLGDPSPELLHAAKAFAPGLYSQIAGLKV